MIKILILSFLLTFTYLLFAQVTSIPRREKQGEAAAVLDHPEAPAHREEDNPR
jgi:hypothetical protein